MLSKVYKKPYEKLGFVLKNILAIIVAFCCLVLTVQAASSETRSLKLYYVHTREKAEIVFKKDGKFVNSGLKQLNYFLRDWRRDEPTKMDPRLFDLVWQVYNLSGSNDYIHVISAYRSPTTNNMLRSRSTASGVAKHSQHTLGRAMDFYIPDVNLSKLRQIGLKQEIGGVGYYPRSGSPFVHMDVGSVRHWPRMSRNELMALFPDGKTIHIPNDGKPLARYEQAMAEYNARKGRPAQTVIVKNNSADKQQKVAAALPSVTRPPLPQFAHQEVEQEAIDDMFDLPDGEEAPIPLASPMRAQEQNLSIAANDATPARQADESLITPTAPTLVPIPDFKPNDTPPLAVARLEPTGNNNAIYAVNDIIGDKINATAVNTSTNTQNLNIEKSKPLILTSDMELAYNIPIPAARYKTPEIIKKGDAIAAAIARSTTAAATTDSIAYKAPIQTNDISKIINDNSKSIKQANESNIDNTRLARIIANNNALKSVSLPVEKDRGLSPSLAIQEQKEADHTLNSSKNNIAAQELREIPTLVFASGLQKEKSMPQNAKLTGRAINFQAIARIN